MSEEKKKTEKEVVSAAFGKMIMQVNMGDEKEIDGWLDEIVNVEIGDTPKLFEDLLKDVPKFMRHMTIKQFLEMFIELQDEEV